VSGLSVEISGRSGTAYILNDISFEVGHGETVCLVGESGCGKSMTALAIMRLIPDPGRIHSGSVKLRGTESRHDQSAANAAHTRQQDLNDLPGAHDRA